MSNKKGPTWDYQNWNPLQNKKASSGLGQNLLGEMSTSSSPQRISATQNPIDKNPRQCVQYSSNNLLESDLKMQNHEFYNRIIEMNESLQKKLEESQNKIQKLEDALQSSLVESENLRQNLTESEHKRLENHESIDKLRSKLLNEKDNLSGKIEILNHSEISYLKTIKELQFDIQCKNNQLDQLNKELDACKEKLESRLKLLKKENANDLSEMRTEIAKKSNDLEMITSELQRKEKFYAQQKEEYEANLHSTNQALVDSKRHISELSSQVHKLEQEKEAIASGYAIKLKELQKSFSVVRMDLTKTGDRLAKYETVGTELQKQQEVKQQEMEEKMAKLGREVIADQEILEESNQKIKTKLEKLDDDKTRIMERIARLRTDMDQLDREDVTEGRVGTEVDRIEEKMKLIEKDAAYLAKLMIGTACSAGAFMAYLCYLN